MTTKAQEQRDKRAVLENDRSAREQAGTFLSHTHTDTGGRFAAAEHQTIIGQDGPPRYPVLPSGPWSGSDPVPNEPPLGFSVNEMPPLEPPVTSSPSDDAAQAPDGSVVADPSAAHSDVDRATGPSSFSRRKGRR